MGGAMESTVSPKKAEATARLEVAAAHPACATASSAEERSYT